MPRSAVYMSHLQGATLLRCYHVLLRRYKRHTSQEVKPSMPAHPERPSSSSSSRYLVNRATKSRTLAITLTQGEVVRAWR